MRAADDHRRGRAVAGVGRGSRPVGSLRDERASARDGGCCFGQRVRVIGEKVDRVALV